MIIKKLVPIVTLGAIVSPVAFISSCSSTSSDSQISFDQVVENATFSVDDQLKEKFADEINLNDLKWNQASQYGNINVSFLNLEKNCKTGTIQFDAKFSDSNQSKIRIANRISGFKTDAVINPQDLVDEEVTRLKKLNNQAQLVKTDVVSQSDLIIWNQSPNLFLKHLNSLDVNNFNYNINSFTNQAETVSFEMVISCENVSANLKLEANVNLDPNNGPIVRPPVTGNLSIIEAREKARIDYDWKLDQTSFSDKDLEAINKNPNLILKHLKQFVYQQYFQYQVIDFSFKQTQEQKEKDQGTISFKIKARFWRKEGALTELISKNHQYQIQTFMADDNRAPAPKNPTNQNWEISALQDRIEFDFTNDANKFDANQLFIKKDNQIDFNEIPTKNFLKQLIDANKLVQIDGNLPSDWSWDLYLDYIPGDYSNFNNQQFGKEEPLTVIINYTNSQNLEESVQFVVVLKNLNVDENAIKTYDAKAEFDQFQQRFEKEIKPKVQLDLNKIVGNQNDPVNQFAMLDANNFLNYTNQNWNALIKPFRNNIRITTKNVKINYLTNEIDFNWVLTGYQEYNGFKWEDPSNSKLKLTTSVNINQDGFNFNQANGFKIDLNNFHQFNFSAKMIDRDDLKNQLVKFNKNWTWMARELVTFVWFTLYQAFDNSFSNLAMMLVDKNNQSINFDNLETKYDQYKIIAKAKLDFKTQQQATFLPFIQVFGTALNLKSTTYRTDDEITIEVNVNNILDQPDPVQDATEILPGMGQGLTLGSGLGYEDTIKKWPPRFDIWRAQMGSFNFSIYHNQTLLGSLNNNHRFISFNTMALYDYRDQFWPEPDQENGKWVSGSFWLN